MSCQSLLKASKAELEALESQLQAQYQEWCNRNLKLDMSRGKPAPDQLDISMDALQGPKSWKSAANVDARNYGILDGLPEVKEFFASALGIDSSRIIVGGNSSLNMMYDAIARLMLKGTNGNTPWCKLDKVKFLCPAPGYDRHFAICQELGIEMITIPMTATGPNMDMVEELVAQDDSIKGIWCVPLYSNPQGVCYSDETVKRLASMKCAAADFRIFWDNAYGVHHLYEPVKLYDIFTACEEAGNPERAFCFFSTSKITFPGAGVAMMAAGPISKAEILKNMGIQTIGFDKLNQLRTLEFLKDAETLTEQMKKQAALIRPKFELVLEILERELGGTDLATWLNPKGGYFVALDTMPGCAKATLSLAAAAGVTMTGAGATFPYKKDPNDTNIRIAPTYPDLTELKQAMELFCVCVKLAGVRNLLSK